MRGEWVNSSNMTVSLHRAGETHKSLVDNNSPVLFQIISLPSERRQQVIGIIIPKDKEAEHRTTRPPKLRINPATQSQASPEGHGENSAIGILSHD